MDFVRAYAPSDRDDCLRLFDGNAPDFFAASERQDFADFLERQPAGVSFQVVERDGRLVACGGHFVEDDGETAGLCWGMVDRSLQGTGLGHILTEARLRAIRATPGVKRVRLDTSQHTHGFYARFGFQREAISPDGYGPGLERWNMILRF